MLDCFRASLIPPANPSTGCTEQGPFFVCLLAACKIHRTHRAGWMERLCFQEYHPAAAEQTRASCHSQQQS